MRDNQKIKICFLGNMLGRNPGYITTQGQILSDLFEADGYEVTCVSSYINKALRLGEIASTIVRKSKQFDVAVLDVYSGQSFIIAGVVSRLCKLVGLPLIMVARGGNLPDFSMRYPKWTKKVFRRAAAVIAPSGFLKEQLKHIDPEIIVFPNIINLAKYEYRNRSAIEPRLFWMRSFHPIYNPSMAVEVLARVKNVYPEATLVMGGNDKGIEEETRQTVARLGLDDSVEFAGFLDFESKMAAFDAANIYLNTNDIDNMPVSVVESAAKGVVVVATEVGGIPHLLTHGETALLCEAKNIDGMTDAVMRLLENPDLTSRLSENGRELAERSGWETVKPQWLALFREVLNKSESRGRSDDTVREGNLGTADNK